MQSDFLRINGQLKEVGFCVVPEIYTDLEVNRIIAFIEASDKSNANFLKSKDVYAIRGVLNELPELTSIVFNQKLLDLISGVFSKEYFLVKAIYFDKPASSNWVVPYHQDLTISVKEKIEQPGFVNWTIKNGQFAVQPPVSILEKIFTIRIHLDDTDENNGALKVIPKSHTRGLIRVDQFNFEAESEVICKVPKGGLMFMRPLLLHASNRTVNSLPRRVIHLEFSNCQLPGGLNWAEKFY